MDHDAGLLARVAWLIGLRWIAAASVVVLAAWAVHVLHFDLPLFWLQALGVTVAIYNLAFRTWLRRLRALDPAHRRISLIAHTNVQIATDLLALAIVIHLTGGIESPLVFFVVFHMIIASMILSRTAAFAQATFMVALYAGLIYLERLGILPHRDGGLGADPMLYRSVKAWLLFLVVATTVYVAAYLATSLAGELHEREQQQYKLSQELAAQAGACQLAYASLEQTQRVQVEYMQRIAHELKSPLSAISMMLRATLDLLPDTMPQKVQDMLNRAASRATAALNLTEDLLTLSQVREAAPAEELADVSLSHLIENVIEEEELSANQRGVRLVTDIEDGLPMLRGYRTELLAMLRNLVSNAIKYSPQGGEVVVRSRTENGSVVVEVQDDGMGISPEELPRIFDEFYRTSTVRRAGISGTGLGLPIVKSVVERHRGEITVDSEVGKGTTFRVRIPTAASPTTEPAPPAATG